MKRYNACLFIVLLRKKYIIFKYLSKQLPVVWMVSGYFKQFIVAKLFRTSVFP